MVCPANAFDSRLLVDKVPLGSSPTNSQKKKDFSVGGPQSPFSLSLFPFHSLLRLTSFLSQNKKNFSGLHFNNN